MNIKRMVQAHTKRQGWPTEPLRIGPATCGQTKNGLKSTCRTAHAYAEAVGQTTMFDETFFSFVFDRPCNHHEAAWDLAKRREMGLSV